MSQDKSKPGPNPAAADGNPANDGDKRSSGRVKFDDRGNAVWEWQGQTGSYGLKRLEHSALSLADDAPTTTVDAVRNNPTGTKKGYDPYDSGKLGKSGKPAKKKDLRRLSEWLKLKRQQAELKKDEDEK